MNIGAMRRRVFIEFPSSKQDAYGQVSRIGGVAEEFCVTWGEVQDLSGRELFTAEEMHSQITTRIRIRWRRGVLPSMQARTFIGDQEHVYDITAVTDPDGRRRELVLECKERVD